MKRPKKTAGELSLAASKDQTKYDPLEVAHALTEKVADGIRECIANHEKIIGEDEYFICVITASDPLLVNALRIKYCALLFLPKPRPQQTVFLYNKPKETLRRLWSLPDAKTMAVISEMPHVAPQWQKTKQWADSFFRKTFHQDIRAEHGISHLSEEEFLDMHNKKVVEPLLQECAPGLSQPFDFSKIAPDQVVYPDQAASE